MSTLIYIMNTSLHCKSPSPCTAWVLYLYGKTDSTKFPDLYKNNELTITTFCLAATAGHLLQPSSTNNNFKINYIGICKNDKFWKKKKCKILPLWCSEQLNSAIATIHSLLRECHWHLVKRREAFVPPKPKEFDKAADIGISFEAVKGMKLSLNIGSGLARLSVNGATPWEKKPQHLFSNQRKFFKSWNV